VGPAAKASVGRRRSACIACRIIRRSAPSSRPKAPPFSLYSVNLGPTNVAIQRPDISHQEVTNLFWINVGAGCALGLAVAGLGPSVALFYRDDHLAAVVAFLASTFVINGISAQHFGVMQRRFNIVRLVSIDVGSAVGIEAAFFGCGYWSLAIVPVVNDSSHVRGGASPRVMSPRVMIVGFCRDARPP
jgi:hypothetical protein